MIIKRVWIECPESWPVLHYGFRREDKWKAHHTYDFPKQKRIKVYDSECHWDGQGVRENFRDWMASNFSEDPFEVLSFSRANRREAKRKKEIRVKSVRIIYLRWLCIMRWFSLHQVHSEHKKIREKRTSVHPNNRLQHSILQFIFIHGRRGQGRNRLNGSIYERLSLLLMHLNGAGEFFFLLLARLSCFLNFILSHTFQSFWGSRDRSIFLGARSSVLVLFSSPFDTSLVSIEKKSKKELATGSFGRDPQFQFPIIIIFNAPLGTWIFSCFDFDRDFCFNFPSFSLGLGSKLNWKEFLCPPLVPRLANCLQLTCPYP